MPTIYDTITTSIVRSIEQGAGTYTMPWHGRGAATGMPRNAITGNGYQGSNVLGLWIAARDAAFSTPTWATYKQWQSIGAQVRKGERGTACIKWKEIEDKRRPADAPQGDSPARCLIGLGFTLFNADQVDGYQATGGEAIDTTVRFDPIERAELVAKASGAVIHHGGARAFYRPSTDEVVLPDRFRFIGTATSSRQETYYATLFHELSHWTGHASRLDRQKGKRWGDEGYAFEELVAELSAAFICSRLGITNEPRADHAQYIANWLQVLKNDNRAIFSAASAAQKACDFIVNRLPAPIAAPVEPLQLAA